MQTRAVRILHPGGPEVLQLGSIDLADPKPGEVRIAVAAAGLNRADCLQRRGVYPAPPGVPPDVPGLEYAGVIDACGEGVDPNRTGQRVMGITGGGAMAGHLHVDVRECLPVPDGMSLTDAAAIPEAFVTAFDALVLQGDMRAGDQVLLHAVGSGVGTAALQLVNAWNATGIGTSRTPEKLARSEALGLTHSVHIGGDGFASALKELGGADVILDTIGAKYLKDNLRSLRTGGRMVVIGLLGGVAGELNLGALLRKRATIHGSVLRSRSLEEKVALAAAFSAQVLPHFETRILRPVVDAVLPMAEVRQAHERMEAGDTFGKIVLRWSHDE